MSLWTAPLAIDPLALRYTVGNDRELDLILLPFDCQASIAHAQGLMEIGILSESELADMTACLLALKEQTQKGQLTIPAEMEDGHEFIENYLQQKLGESGKKIHTYRSRNDQVWTALLLLIRHRLDEILAMADTLSAALTAFKAQYGQIPLPGFSHTRKAMPTTLAAWSGLYLSALQDSGQLLSQMRQIINQCPLGSGAGYGFVGGPDRQKVAARLGFDGAQKEVMYAQYSRSKYSAWVIFACLGLMQDLSHLASDLIFFSLPEFAFFRLPGNMLLGSSVMPHKRNPDVLEMVRGNTSVVLAHQQRVMTLGMNLIYGYHRDLQLTKQPLLESLSLTIASLDICARFVAGLEVDEAACRRAMSDELYSVERALARTKTGESFRDAHAKVAQAGWNQPKEGENEPRGSRHG